MSGPPAERWVRTTEALARLADALSSEPAIALDTESDSLHHHRAKVCLVQLGAADGRGWLVDPLALPDLAPIGPLLADPRVVKVLHGADYDVTTVKRDFGLAITPLFDTMIAARFLGRSEVGLQAVLRDEFGVAVSKDSQKDDWSRRPLEPRQEAYALADVEHLVELHARYRRRLEEMGRLSWVVEECEAVSALPAARRGNDADAYLDAKGARALGRRGLAVLRALWQWREAQAGSADVPLFKIASTELLVALAAARPADPRELASHRLMTPRLRRQARALFAAVESAAALPEDALPVITPAPRPVVAPAVRQRVDRLKAWRAEEAARVGLDVSLVLPGRLLDKVAEAAPADTAALATVPGIRRWRVEAFGTAMVAAARGAPPPAG